MVPVAMWTALTLPADRPGTLRFQVQRAAAPASFADVIEAWQEDAGFRSWFNAVLAEVPFVAFRWETPAVSSRNVRRPFEFVVLDSPTLARSPDPEAFAEHFRAEATPEVVVFPNLGRDTVLVVPRPLAPPGAYGHLGAFVRRAPEHQQQALWRAVGEAMARRHGARPVWLSTAGAGVSWLHVRLDDRPKYYGFAPYRAAEVSL